MAPRGGAGPAILTPGLRCGAAGAAMPWRSQHPPATHPAALAAAAGGRAARHRRHVAVAPLRAARRRPPAGGRGAADQAPQLRLRVARRGQGGRVQGAPRSGRHRGGGAGHLRHRTATVGGGACRLHRYPDGVCSEGALLCGAPAVGPELVQGQSGGVGGRPALPASHSQGALGVHHGGGGRPGAAGPHAPYSVARGRGRGMPPGAAVATLHRFGGTGTAPPATFGGLGAQVCKPACTQGMTVASSETG